MEILKAILSVNFCIFNSYFCAKYYNKVSKADNS